MVFCVAAHTGARIGAKKFHAKKAHMHTHSAKSQSKTDKSITTATTTIQFTDSQTPLYTASAPSYLLTPTPVFTSYQNRIILSEHPLGITHIISNVVWVVGVLLFVTLALFRNDNDKQ
jgi:hypothetical protein